MPQIYKLVKDLFSRERLIEPIVSIRPFCVGVLKLHQQ
jgi:hypothetical protein